MVTAMATCLWLLVRFQASLENVNNDRLATVQPAANKAGTEK